MSGGEGAGEEPTAEATPAPEPEPDTPPPGKCAACGKDVERDRIQAHSGFNGAPMHQRVGDDRSLKWCGPVFTTFHYSVVVWIQPPAQPLVLDDIRERLQVPAGEIETSVLVECLRRVAATAQPGRMVRYNLKRSRPLSPLLYREVEGVIALEEREGGTRVHPDGTTVTLIGAEDVAAT